MVIKSLCLSLLLACNISTSEIASPITSCSVADFGAIPDDGVDDRLAIQSAITAGCAKFASGKYDIVTPAVPRPIAMLTLPVATEMFGDGATPTVLSFSGDPQGADWRGIQVNSGTYIHNLSFVVDMPVATTREQMHVVRGDGPLIGVTIKYTTCDSPIVAGSKRGDCFQFVGYEPNTTSPDKRIWDLELSYNTIIRSPRSGIAIHSGVHGTLVDGHYTTRIHHNIFQDVSDQDIDEEGSYLQDDAPSIDGLELDHNTFNHIPSPLTSTAVSLVYSGHTWMHDNNLNGRGMVVDACYNCDFGDNTIVQSIPTSIAAVVFRRAIHDTTIHDEHYTREASAGVGSVVELSQLVTGYPLDVTIKDYSLIQRAPGNILHSFGSVSLQMKDGVIVYDHPPENPTWFTMDLSGSSATATTGIVINRLTITGPIKAAARISGAYAGAGTFDVEHLTSPKGLWCEDTSTITGPITYKNNNTPLPLCPLSLLQ
jgi:hypothetical protein